MGEFTVDFGADHPARFKSAKHGTWKQTGPRELTLTLLGFDYGQEEDNPNLVFGPENRVTGTIRIINTISFEEGFEKFSEEGSVEIFLAVDRADPLDPNAEPSIGPFRHSATGRRIPQGSTGSSPVSGTNWKRRHRSAGSGQPSPCGRFGFSRPCTTLSKPLST